LTVCLCCSFLIVPSVYSSVYFVLCLVYPMLPVCLCYSFLIVPSVYSSVYFVLCLVYPIRVNRRDDQEWITQRHWQHRIHKTQDKINTRVNRSCSFLIVPSVYSSVYFVLCLVYAMLPVSLCCSFLIVPSVYSSVYFVLCLVYPMLSVSLCCSFLIVQRHWQHRIHKTQDKINTRGNRRDNQEWITQRHWQHRTHKTQDKINTRVNRRDNQEWTTLLFTRVFILSCILCIRCCQCLCVVHSWLSLLFTRVLTLSCVLCIQCCQCLCVVHSWLSLLGYTRYRTKWTLE
jgi:hypothetical protein